MHAYTLRLKFRSTLPPDDAGIRVLTDAIQDTNRTTNDYEMVEAFRTLLRIHLYALMLDDQAEPIVTTIEYEGPFHKVKRKR